jgi:DNA invertase Pin-like site-specific DNA recombinase
MSSHYAPPPQGLHAGARVWAYLRDSGGPSQERSVDQQEQELRAYCNKYGLVLIRIFQDVARSGGSTIGRAEFMEMVDLSENPDERPSGILIWNFARFARNLREAQFYKSQLRLKGIIIHSITDQIPADDHIGELVENVTDWMNEEKRRQTSRDVKRGLKDLISKGFSAGPPPRGYRALKVTIGEKRDGMPRVVSKWEPDPVLAELAKIAWQLRAQGKSYQEISRATYGKLYSSKNCWKSFFANKSYLGIGKSGDLEVPDHHEPLITWETWEAVQKLNDVHPLSGKKGSLNHPRRIGNPSLFSGFTYCIECGAMMIHSIDKRKKSWRFYLCGKKDRHGALTCSSKRVAGPNAEQQILTAVLSQVLTPAYLADVIAETKKNLDSTADIERQIKAAARRLEDLEIIIQRNLNTIERTGSPAAQERLKQREAESTQTKRELESLQLQLAAARMDITPEAMEIILATWRAQFNELRESGNVRGMKAWLLQFVSRIDLGYNRARIFYTYPINAIIDLVPQGHVTESLSLGPPLQYVVKSMMVEWSK